MVFYFLFACLDWVVYSLIGPLFSVIMQISNISTSIFGGIGTGTSIIEELTNKVYVVLGIIMLFKIIISCIQYLINPDTMDDKEKGMMGILKRTIIAICLLALVPEIFGFAREVQDEICVNLPKIILNTEPDKGTNFGNEMALDILLGFVKEKKTNTTVTRQNPNFDNLGKFIGSITEGCAYGFLGLGGIFDTSKCIYEYKWFISTIVGGFLAFVLVGMAIDLAVRALKFALLEILAPVAIASYVDPKTSEKSFKKWYTMSIKVYVDLFIRLSIVYFVVYFIKIILSNDIARYINDEVKGHGGDDFTAFIVIIFLIMGLITFAKQAPKFISDILGLDIGGDDFKDIFKAPWKREGAAMLGRAGMLAGQAGLTFGSNIANRFHNNKDLLQTGNALQNTKNALKTLGSGIAGATSTLTHGGAALAHGKNMHEISSAGYGRAIKARQNRDLDQLNNVSGIDRLKVRFQDYIGWDSEASLAEARIKAHETIISDMDSYKSTARDVFREHASEISISYNKGMRDTTLELLHNDELKTIFGNLDGRDEAGNLTELGKLQQKIVNNSATYEDLITLRNIAQSRQTDTTLTGEQRAAWSRLEAMLGDNDVHMKKIQKKGYALAAAGQLRGIENEISTTLNIGQEECDAALMNAYIKMKQDFVDNAVAMSYSEGDDGFNPNDAAAEFEARFKGGNLFETIEKRSKSTRDEIRHQITTTESVSTEKAARDSIRRRNENKK